MTVSDLLGTIPAPPAGRPGTGRDARRQCILDAALELVQEVGYDRLSMDALAERARAGKATIYRHWSGKAEVVAEAIRCRKCDSLGPLADTGTFRGDLLAELGQMVSTFSADDADLLIGVFSAMHKDADLAALVRSQMADAKRARLDELVDRAVARGELAPDTSPDLLHEVLPALIINRVVLNGEPPTDEFVVHLVDDIALPLLT